MKLSEVLDDGRQGFYDLQTYLFAVEEALLSPSSLLYIRDIYGVNAKDFTFDTDGCVVYLDATQEESLESFRLSWDEIMDIIENAS